MRNHKNESKSQEAVSRIESQRAVRQKSLDVLETAKKSQSTPRIVNFKNRPESREVKAYKKIKQEVKSVPKAMRHQNKKLMLGFKRRLRGARRKIVKEQSK